MAFKLTCEGFEPEDDIPERYTCDGENTPPTLRWHGEPEGTASFAIIVDDPDAPGGPWNHWLLWDIPATKHVLDGAGGDRFAGTAGLNDFGELGYGGPCPPPGRAAHRYFFRLFALDVPTVGLPEGTERRALERALQKHALAETHCMGRYQRH